MKGQKSGTKNNSPAYIYIWRKHRKQILNKCRDEGRDRQKKKQRQAEIKINGKIEGNKEKDGERAIE